MQTRDFAVMSLVFLEEVVLPLVSYRHQAVLLWHSCWSVSRTALFRPPDGMGSRAVSMLPRQCGASSVLHAAQVSNVRF